MLEVRNVSKTFHKYWALKGLNFTLKAGDRVGLIGPNGAGKTTALSVLAGSLNPSQGEVFFNSKDVYENPYEYKKNVGYQTQIPPLFSDMTVQEFLKYVADLKHLTDDSAIESVIETTQLQEVLKKRPSSLSQGFKQRLNFAQALIGDPQILILDEPTNGLDPKQARHFRQSVKNLDPKKTLILSTHILSEVEEVCNRFIFIDRGEIKFNLSLEDFFEKAQTHTRLRLKVFHPHKVQIEILKKIEGVNSVTGDGSWFDLEIQPKDECICAISQTVVEKGWGLLAVESERPNLEKIFLQKG